MNKKDLVFTICLGVVSAVATVVLGKKAKEIREKQSEEISTVDICEEVEEDK